MKNVGYYNGKIGLIEEMSVPMDDRALYFGDGVYDVAFVINRVPFAMDDHIDRFFSSCELLEMPFPMTKAELKKELVDLIDLLDEDIPNAVLYWQASRGVAPRNHVYPDVKPTLMATLRAAKLPKPDATLKLAVCEDIRFMICNIKTLNLIPSVMASELAKQRGCGEIVMHRGERVTECAHSGIAILKDGVVRTAPLSCEILPSITRKHLLAICRANGVGVDETSFTLDEMMAADEILVLSSTKLFTPAVEVDGKPVGGKDPALLKKLAGLYQDMIDADYKAWKK